MKPWQWWLGVSVIGVAIAFHALFPRYQVLAVGSEGMILTRVDRWRGTVESTLVAEPFADWARWLEAAGK